jgi:hypothetical protein
VATIGPVWDWAIYGALAVGAAAILAAAGLLAVRVLEGLRTLKRFRRRLAKELLHLADLGGVTTEKLEHAADTRELESSLARLRTSLARAAVLRSALDEARGTFGRVAWVYPRK